MKIIGCMQKPSKHATEWIVIDDWWFDIHRLNKDDWTINGRESVIENFWNYSGFVFAPLFIKIMPVEIVDGTVFGETCWTVIHWFFICWGFLVF